MNDTQQPPSRHINVDKDGKSNLQAMGHCSYNLLSVYRLSWLWKSSIPAQAGTVVSTMTTFESLHVSCRTILYDWAAVLKVTDIYCPPQWIWLVALDDQGDIEIRVVSYNRRWRRVNPRTLGSRWFGVIQNPSCITMMTSCARGIHARIHLSLTTECNTRPDLACALELTKVIGLARECWRGARPLLGCRHFVIFSSEGALQTAHACA